MPTLIERLETAVVNTENYSATLHSIVHGAFNAADVVTTGGNVKTIAKTIYEGGLALAAAVGDLEETATTSAAAASASASSASASASAASASASAASASASASAGSAGAASVSATASAASASAASASATSAAGSASAAASSAAQAALAVAAANLSSSYSATSAAAAAVSAAAAAASAAIVTTNGLTGYFGSINDSDAVTEITAPFPKTIHVERTRVDSSVHTIRTFVLKDLPTAPGVGAIILHRLVIQDGFAPQIVWRRDSIEGPIMHRISTNGADIGVFAMFAYNGADWFYLSSQYPADVQTTIDTGSFSSEFSDEFR